MVMAKFVTDVFLVAILDASLNFLKCPRVTRWHQSVSSAIKNSQNILYISQIQVHQNYAYYLPDYTILVRIYWEAKLVKYQQCLLPRANNYRYQPGNAL